MSQQLSPKKYIETQARKLPIYKCTINTDWEENSIASIFVWRKHKTGSITLGFYLIDLLCLGIKDTGYKFNVSEDEADEFFEKNIQDILECDYNLAHNIIFAGHDFAMEYDIEPHKDFALTKFILEEDDDAVELMDIEVGEPGTGKPHLMINEAGQGRWALAKLIKNAGEGNYIFTDFNFGGEYTEDDFYEEADRNTSLDNFEIDEIDAYSAKSILTSELLDNDKIESRGELEKIPLYIEMIIRTLEKEDDYKVIGQAAFFNTEELDFTYKNLNDIYNCKNGIVQIDELDTESIMEAFFTNLSNNDLGLTLEEKFNNFYEQYKNNFYVLAQLYDYSILVFEDNDHLRQNIFNSIEEFVEDYPLAKLIVLFEILLTNKPNLKYNAIKDAATLKSVFPTYKEFGGAEVLYFWLIKMLAAQKKNNINEIVLYYQLAVEVEINIVSLRVIQIKLLEYLSKLILEE